MDLFVCPSREEAFALVIVEALDAGVPVIASRAEGCCEILGNFPGELYPVDDVAALRTLLAEHYHARKPRQPADLGEFLPRNAGRALLNSYEALLVNTQHH